MRLNNKCKVIICTFVLLLPIAVSGQSEPLNLSEIVHPQWKDGDWFIIEEWSHGELDGRPNRPWRKVGLLQLTIKKGNNEVKNCKWIIQLEEVNGQQVGVEMYTINIYYDKEYNIIGAKGYTVKEKPITIMDAHGWRYYTEYMEHFFQVPKKARSITLERQDSETFRTAGKSEAYRIELENEIHDVDRYQVWKKNMSWWIYLEVGNGRRYWLIQSSMDKK